MSDELEFRDYGVVTGFGKFPDVVFPPKPAERMVLTRQVMIHPDTGAAYVRFRASLENPDNGETTIIFFPDPERYTDFAYRFGFRIEFRF